MEPAGSGAHFRCLFLAVLTASRFCTDLTAPHFVHLLLDCALLLRMLCSLPPMLRVRREEWARDRDEWARDLLRLCLRVPPPMLSSVLYQSRGKAFDAYRWVVSV